LIALFHITWNVALRESNLAEPFPNERIRQHGREDAAEQFDEDVNRLGGQFEMMIGDEIRNRLEDRNKRQGISGKSGSK
jgi:hypothetical protein